MLRELVKKHKNPVRTRGRWNLRPTSNGVKAMIALFACVVFFVANAALAQPNLGINSLAEGGVQLGQTDIRVIVARIVEVFLGLLGTIAVVLIIYGGWLWMSAAGDTTKIAAAKKTLINAVIGLAIILSAFGITQFIVSRLISATTGGFGEEGTGVYGQPLSGSLGAGIIAGHVPDRGASAPRNTKVAVTFKEAIDDKSLVTSSGEADKKVFKMARTAALKQAGNNFKNLSDADLVTLKVNFTPDKLNFVFAPAALLGSPSEPVSYTIFLASGLKKADGAAAFSGAFASGYEWEFQVDPIVDSIPPKIVSIIPSQGINPRNTIVQINFSEGLDPTSASGEVAAGGAGFQNITLSSGGNILAGGYKIGNGYKTVEFTTKDACGTNSCGGTIYCLPANVTVAALVKTATLGAEPPQAAGFPYDGIVDLAGNSLDGNGNDRAQGPRSNFVWNSGNTALGDNVSWQFNTSDQIDLVPPKISVIDPGLSAQNVGLNAPVKATFDKVMSVATLNNSNLFITHDVPPPYEMSYGVDAEALDSRNQPVSSGAEPVKTRAIIKHGAFAPSVFGGAQYNYFPGITSKVQDLRQNCYNPSAGPSCTPTPALPYCCNGTPSAAKCPYLPSAYEGGTLSQNNPAAPPVPPAPPGGGQMERAFYVSPQGDNSAAGTIEKPWRTLQFVADKLIAGDTLYIRKGTYKERVVPQNSGTADKYIIYSAYPGEEAVVDGTGVQLPAGDLYGLFEVSGKSFIKINGLKIMNALTDGGSHGILVNNNSHDIIISKNYIYNTRSSGIGVWNAKNIIIDGNEVAKATGGGQQEAISVARVDTFEVKNNKVHDIDIPADKEGICIKDGSANGKVFKNLIYNTPAAGIYVDAWDKHTYNIDVFQNVVYGVTNSDGFQVASEMGGLLENIKFYNNIGYSNKFRGITVTDNGDEGGAHPMKNITIANNTFYNNGATWGGCIAVDNTEAQDVRIRNNICSQNRSFEISVSPGAAKNTTVENNLINDFKSDIEDNEVRGGHYVEADPLFVNAGAADFHLRTGSPAIDKGFVTDAPAVDFDGRARPQGGGYDIGAFEFI